MAVLLCAMAAASIERPLVAAAIAGVAATIRPELVPWSLSMALGASFAKRESPKRILVALVLALAPFALESAVRGAIFGSVAPLAVRAKPSDVTHGALYALAGLFVAGVFPLVVAPRALFEKRGAALVIVAATCAHIASVIFVGGDWMVYARLFAPIVFPMAYAGALLAKGEESTWAVRGRAALSALLVVATLFGLGRKGVDVNHARATLIESAKPYLEDARCVAALDVGWVSAATEATIVDLAGLTDPEIASLPGGHTSKRVDASMLLSRNVDTVLLYGSPSPAIGARRVVESRLASSPLFEGHFVEVAFLPSQELGETGYTVFKKRK